MNDSAPRRILPNGWHDGGLSDQAIAQYIAEHAPKSALLGPGGERLRAETDTGQYLPVTQSGLTPAEFASYQPTRVALVSARHVWDNVVVQRFLYASTVVEVPGTRDHRLVLHLAGPALIEKTSGGRYERRWSDSGHIAVTPAGLPITRSIKGRPDLVHIHLAPALVCEVVAEAFDVDPAHIELTERVATPDEAIDRLGRLLLAEAEGQASGTRLAAEALSRAIAVHLLRRHSSLAPRAPDLPSSAMTDGRLRRVTEYMHANLTEDLPLAQLAAVAGLSPSHFARSFREVTGETPHRRLLRLRVERARFLLEHTTLPVIEISLLCGFATPNHFATMFGKLTGMSPRVWRNTRRT